MNKTITVETVVKADSEKAWELWNAPEHIEKWAHASDDWECTNAKNDLRVGGRFSSRLAAKDKSASFDFAGVYTEVTPLSYLSYTLDDLPRVAGKAGGRKVTVSFTPTEAGTRIVETFEMENENSEEVQRSGWQAMLDNFTSYAESKDA